jgi:hypothetical protein
VARARHLLRLLPLRGGFGLAAFKLAAVVTVFALTTWTAWRRSNSLVFAVGAVVFATYVCCPFLDIPSQLFLFLSLSATMAVLEGYRHGARRWVLGLLPLLMIVWVNTHYSFLYGGGLLLLYGGCETGKSWLGLPTRRCRCGGRCCSPASASWRSSRPS